ncbi:hypothetical protein [Zeimonas arvi]|uniref:Uncharacterized protein n=1 Tax=Zeimonas arvi TaxID=2498847 RepID=A0A5C8NPA9_9BURK|nr:hypothetical protein [Zeimonas arvi]TXL63559.1 hypothetical protein FHP08_17135 [Zeimonas arvi]
MSQLSTAAQQAVERLGLADALYSRKQVAESHRREAAELRAAIEKARHGLQGVVINPPSEADAAQAECKAAEAQSIVDELQAALDAQVAAQEAADAATAQRAAAELQAAEGAVIEAARQLDVAVLARLAAVDDPKAYRKAHAAAEAAKAALAKATRHRDELAGGAR